jgi:cation diffusion facilitator CzcD-associated flavoprotein CzcO
MHIAPNLVHEGSGTKEISCFAHPKFLYVYSTAIDDLVLTSRSLEAPGCKRIIVDPGYLACLHRKNVSQIWDGIDSVVETGMRMKSGGVIDFDVIIFATGFSLEATDLSTRGRKGITVNDWFETQGGTTAYKGTCIPGCPNFFTLLGSSFSCLFIYHH